MVWRMEARREPPPQASDEPRWQWSRLPALAPLALYAALALRQRVFAVEQHCAYLDADGIDVHAWHLLGWERAEPGALCAYLRVVDPGARFAEPSIGRVAVAAARRGCGLGRTLMERGIAVCASLHPGRPIRIAAQSRLAQFYASLGFAVASEPFDEDGIAHVEMLLPAPAAAAQRVDIAHPLR